MSQSSIIISNLPPRADADFLNVLLDGHVKDSLWFGYQAERSAIVELDSVEYGIRLLEAQSAFQDARASGTLSRKGNKQKKKKSNVAEVAEDTDDLSIAQLLTMGEAPADKTKKGNDAKLSSPLEASVFYGDVLCDERILFFGRCSLSLTEILATAAVPGRVAQQPSNPLAPAKATAQKRQRLSQEVAAITGAEIVSTADDASPVEAVTKKSRADSSAGATASKQELDTTVKSLRATGSDECKKCGSTQHLTRHCPGISAASAASTSATAPPTKVDVTISVARVNETEVEHPKKAVVPLAVRTSKDACKYCGSELHLSRHCPKK